MTAETLRRLMPLVLIVPGIALVWAADRLSANAPERARTARIEAAYLDATGVNARLEPRGEAAGVVWFVPVDAAVGGCVGVAAGEGYRSRIELAVVLAPPDRIAGVTVLEEDETAAYGAKVLADGAWLARFEGLGADAPDAIAPARHGGRIDAISGATITSDTAIDLVRRVVTAPGPCQEGSR